MRRRATAGRIFALFAVVLAVSGCGGAPPEDATLYGKLDNLVETKLPVPLAALTDFQWDRAYFFDSYTPGDEVNSEVGGHVLASWRSVPEDDGLLVFDLRGVPVRSARVSTNVTRTNRGPGSDRLSHSVMAQPSCGLVYLVEVGDPPPSGDCNS